jgi:hypothetical protein
MMGDHLSRTKSLIDDLVMWRAYRLQEGRPDSASARSRGCEFVSVRWRWLNLALARRKSFLQLLYSSLCTQSDDKQSYSVLVINTT